MNARTLILGIFALALPPALTISAQAHESPEELAENMGQLPEESVKPIAKSEHRKEELSEHPAEEGGNHPVVAMESKTGKAVRATELFTAGAEPATLISRHNQKYELSPRSVVELDGQGALRLLRGSVVAESREEIVIGTAGARVAFLGKALISYDHAEKSTSAFVLEGEARLENAHRTDSSLRLQRFHGATMVVGEVLPQLVRQLDVGSVQGWLAGYSWPTARSKALLRDMPGTTVVALVEEAPKHLEETKIEDYFSSIDTADEFHQPDYYDKKFDDPDKVVAEANSKQGASKPLTPEEAALISLPKTQIDLGFDLGPEFLTAKEKKKELATVDPSAKPVRSPASAPVLAKKMPKQKTAPVQSGDPEVNYVLERLRQVRTGNSAVSQAPSQRERAPASRTESVVPDPAYDYSQNF